VVTVSTSSELSGATPGSRFRAALAAEKPLQIVGTINAYAALLAQRAGFRAIYLSGAGVANASYGMPDLGMTSLDNVLEDVRRITGACDLPLLVDVDTGWGAALSIARTIREMQRAGAAAVHIEDQVTMKRCGHRPGKAVVSAGEMVDRIKSAVDGRSDPDFVIMARTDAAAVEGLDAAIERSLQYVEAGADMIFAEAMRSLDEYRAFCSRVRVPVLANLTEFGKTPLLTRDALAGVGVAMTLYPLSAFRAMSRAAERAFAAIRADRQADVLSQMQTRDELYDVLGYHEAERRIDLIIGTGHPDAEDK
jgi:methylisocitrate lyase